MITCLRFVLFENGETFSEVNDTHGVTVPQVGWELSLYKDGKDVTFIVTNVTADYVWFRATVKVRRVF